MSDKKIWSAQWNGEKIIWTTCKESEFHCGHNVSQIEGSDMITFESEKDYANRMKARKIKNAENRALTQANQIARNLGF
jgi:hypothetical protein